MSEQKAGTPAGQNPLSVKVRSSGFTEYCGLKFTEIGDERCVMTCPLRPEVLNPGGIAHGGVIATLSDVCTSAMALQADGGKRRIVTQSCSIHYLSPGTGEALRCEARVIRKGRRVCVVQADCFSGDGTLCAVATYEIAYLNVPREE